VVLGEVVVDAWPNRGSSTLRSCRAIDRLIVMPLMNCERAVLAIIGTFSGGNSLCIVHLSPASMPGWLPSVRGTVSSTGRAKDF
jgi:hypothetical protein